MTDRRVRLLSRRTPGSDAAVDGTGHRYDQVMTEPQQDSGEATETETVEKFNADGSPLTPEQEAQQAVGDTTTPEEGDDSKETEPDAD